MNYNFIPLLQTPVLIWIATMLLVLALVHRKLFVEIRNLKKAQQNTEELLREIAATCFKNSNKENKQP